MKKIITVLFFACTISSHAQNNSQKLDGEYCDRAGNIMAFCMSFKGDTFYSGVVSMMFNYVGKGTYEIKDNELILNYCKGDSSRYVDGTVPSGTVKKYKIKKITSSEIIIRDEEKKDFTTLKKEKQ